MLLLEAQSLALGLPTSFRSNRKPHLFRTADDQDAPKLSARTINHNQQEQSHGEKPAKTQRKKKKKKQHHHNLAAYHGELDLASLSQGDQSRYHELASQCLVHPAMFPVEMRKYWRNRHRLFSLYDQGCLLDSESWFSVTPESVAFRIAARCSSERTVLDLFGGAGGNAIQFALTAEQVLVIEIDELKIQLAEWNAEIYGVRDRIRFVHGDAVEFLHAVNEYRRDSATNGESSATESDVEVYRGITRRDVDQIHVVFLSPPWGGVNYMSHDHDFSLNSLLPIPGKRLFELATAITPNIAYYLPRNTSLHQLAELADLNTDSTVKIEQQWLSEHKLSSITAYYGQLATEWDDDKDAWITS
ncbi:hypothetical protein BCV70DRAFT_159548 [Testicularia cyperi]|uniref:Trimethylguanosine synthase n=1 Tax=Testicularia cyperi TaxID=1882483 RepID=A0A317XSU4_9BASI|nr:hypothetical protein BCV70DRAFT_159548 [Testicularia cyperi]